MFAILCSFRKIDIISCSKRTFFSQFCHNIGDNNFMCILILSFSCWNVQEIRLLPNLTSKLNMRIVVVTMHVRLLIFTLWKN